MKNEIKVVIKAEKGRVDKVLVETLKDYSRSQIQAWLKEDAVTINGEVTKANRKVAAGDEIVSRFLNQLRWICYPKTFRLKLSMKMMI